MLSAIEIKKSLLLILLGWGCCRTDGKVECIIFREVQMLELLTEATLPKLLSVCHW